MPSGTFSSVQADVKAGKPAPVYLIVGDDERGKDEVVHLFDALVPDDIRPFNLERLSAPETDPADGGGDRAHVSAARRSAGGGRHTLREVADEPPQGIGR